MCHWARTKERICKNLEALIAYVTCDSLPWNFFLFLAEWKFSLIRNKGYISESNLPDERGREELLQHKDKLFAGANFSVVKESLDLKFSLSKL